MKYNLEAQYDSRTSFYGKAVIIEDGKTLKLQSYETIVAEIDTEAHTAKVYNMQSVTTVRHIKEFLLQNKFRAESSAQIKADYFREG